MAENNRNVSVVLLVLALIGAALFYGCGSATSDSFPAIEYSISGSYSSEGLSSVNVTSARAVSGLAAGILIYSESDPTNYADIDEANRKYVIRNLKPGSHYIVFRHIPNGINGTNYIYRTSKPVVLTETSPVKEISEVLRATLGTVSVTGKLTNSNGQLITPTPTLTLWGQTIEVNPLTGEFTTPQMPERTVADLIVNAINYRQTAIPISFESNPAYYEISAVETTSNNVPPTVTLTSVNSKYNVKSTVTLKAVAEDTNNDELQFVWEIESCTANNKGTLELSTETQKGNQFMSEYYWNAPEDDCLATISVKVVEKNTPQQLSAKAKLKIQIGTGEYQENTKPRIVSYSIYPESLYGNRTYTVTVVATDSDRDVLTNSLVITPSTGTLSKSSGNTWTWKTPDLSEPTAFTLKFSTKDPRGNVATLTSSVTVSATEPNNPPVVVSQDPSSVTNLMSGREIVLNIVANDPENEKLTFTWNTRFGELLSTSKNGGNASATWKAPYVNSNTPATITCVVSDPQGLEDIATYSLVIEPDPEKLAPEIEIVMGGTTVTHNGNLLFKAGETITLSGLATDSNRHISIDDPAAYKWEYRYISSATYINLKDFSKTASLEIKPEMALGDYIVRLTVTDLNNISGEATKEFRINTLPLASILCEGFDTVSGRMSTPSPYTYKVGELEYDVFQYSTTNQVNFTASCTDIETESTVLQNNSVWTHNGESKVGNAYSPYLSATGTNVIELTTKDSKGEWAATATYQYFVNTAPVFEVATSSKKSYINTDDIAIDIRVTDDTASLTLDLYVSYKATASSSYSDYKKFVGIGDNPVVNENNNSIIVHIATTAASLLKYEPNGDSQINDFKVKLVATDNMGLQTENNDIKFNITSPHTINEFTVASGTYYSNKEPLDFQQLINLYGPISVYDFEADQAFSIKSGSSKWQDAMTWTWYDNNTKIAETYVDSSMGYILNGYSIKNEFGTHTIRLEGKSIETEIVASRSIEIFINSTPKIAFKDATQNGSMRCDTGCNATFTISVKEDNPDEVLGLTWTIYELDSNCEEITDNSIPSPRIYQSHELETSSGKSPLYMAGVQEKVVPVYWDEISDQPLASGAKRIYVCAFDAYGKAATASLDLLVNTLPVFNEIISSRTVSIVVPPVSDNGEDYSSFVEQYATTTSGLPVYLVAGNPSMQLNFTSDPSDSEYPTFFDEHPENIVWKYVDWTGSTLTQVGKSIQGRLGIGLASMTVECRDSFFNYYKKDGEYVYNDLCIATTTVSFYIWHSMAWDLPELDSTGVANALYSFGNNDFMLSFYPGVSTYTHRYELNCGVNTTLAHIITCFASIDLQTFENGGYTDTSPVPTYHDIGNVITVIQKDRGDFVLLLNNEQYDCGGLYPRYYDPVDKLERHIGHYITPYTAIGLEDYATMGSGNSNDPYFSFLDNGFPGNDLDFPKRILSMTYSDPSDNTAGAMLVHNWKGLTSAQGGDVVTGYSNLRLWFLEEENAHPLYCLDSDPSVYLNFSVNSKIRYLEKLSEEHDQKLYFTDTNNDRLVRLGADLAKANSIPASKPIDICTTSEKYIFVLSESGETGLSLYSVDKSGGTQLVNFAKILDANSNDFNYRAGKLYNPKSILYYILPSGEDNVFGGLIILEEGMNGHANRIQLIRSNKPDWLE